MECHSRCGLVHTQAAVNLAVLAAGDSDSESAWQIVIKNKLAVILRRKNNTALCLCMIVRATTQYAATHIRGQRMETKDITDITSMGADHGPEGWLECDMFCQKQPTNEPDSSQTQPATSAYEVEMSHRSDVVDNYLEEITSQNSSEYKEKLMWCTG